MNIFAFVFLLAALIVFLFAYFSSGWKDWLALGLALVSGGLIWQFASTSHTFHF